MVHFWGAIVTLLMCCILLIMAWHVLQEGRGYIGMIIFERDWVRDRHTQVLRYSNSVRVYFYIQKKTLDITVLQPNCIERHLFHSGGAATSFMYGKITLHVRFCTDVPIWFFVIKVCLLKQKMVCAFHYIGIAKRDRQQINSGWETVLLRQ